MRLLFSPQVFVFYYILALWGLELLSEGPIVFELTTLSLMKGSYHPYNGQKQTANIIIIISDSHFLSLLEL